MTEGTAQVALLGPRGDGGDDRAVLRRALHANVAAAALQQEDFVLARAAAEATDPRGGQTAISSRAA